MDAALLTELDGARGRISRSQFVREAIAEKLRSLGFSVREDIVFPPDRVSVTAKVTGKGNTVNQSFHSTSQDARVLAKLKPKRERKKTSPEK